MAADTSKPFFPADPHPRLLPSRRNPHLLTPESRYWRSFRSSELAAGLLLPVTSLAFSPSQPLTLAASCSASVHLFSGDPLAPRAPLSSPFPDLAFSPSFRCDGALFAAGCANGAVQVFRSDKPTSGPLRRLRAHAAAARVVRYPVAGADKLHLLSAGDDALVAYWDVPAEAPLLSIPGAHRDYIRAAAPSPADPNLFATGSYDHGVKLWDVRVGDAPSLAFSHGAPVESALFLPSGGLLATAGGNSVKIWDVIGGGRLLHSVESHNKTVTGLVLGRITTTGESRLLSVSIDGYLKSFDFGEFKITHSMRYPAQLLSVACSPCGTVRVAGTSNGVIYMGKKKKRAAEEDEGGKVDSEFDWAMPEPEKPVLRPTNYRYFLRGQSEKPREGDFIIDKPKKVKLSEHDKLLKKFMHKDSLVSALIKNNTRSVVAVMEELVARRKLVRSIGNMDTDELGLLLGFLHRNATLPRYARLLMGVANKVVEMRADDIQLSDDLRRHVTNLKAMVAEEIQIQRSLQGIQGMISPLLVLAGR